MRKTVELIGVRGGLARSERWRIVDGFSRYLLGVPVTLYVVTRGKERRCMAYPSYAWGRSAAARKISEYMTLLQGDDFALADTLCRSLEKLESDGDIGVAKDHKRLAIFRENVQRWRLAIALGGNES